MTGGVIAATAAGLKVQERQMSKQEMTEQATAPRLATVKEACAYAKMGHTKLYEKINARAIVAYKRDRKTLVDLDSIDAMNARELQPWKPGTPQT
jgi:hypothetical protein